MTDLTPFADLIPQEHGLCVVTTLRSDGTPQSTVVNAGVLAHPVTGAEVVGFVSAGTSQKLVHLRANPVVAISARVGWQWATAEGTAELIGPDDPSPDVDAERLRALLRDVFTAAGGTHDDWPTYDQVMRDERRTAVLVTAGRVYTNPA